MNRPKEGLGDATPEEIAAYGDVAALLIPVLVSEVRGAQDGRILLVFGIDLPKALRVTPEEVREGAHVIRGCVVDAVVRLLVPVDKLRPDLQRLVVAHNTVAQTSQNNHTDEGDDDHVVPFTPPRKKL